MASSGHGISDAVRECVRDWMTDRVCDIMFKEAIAQAIVSPNERSSFISKLRSADSWKRIVRKKSPKAGVFQRTYYSQMFGSKYSSRTPGMTVLTNPARKGQAEDMYIEYVTITLGGKVIGGGSVSVPSVMLSQTGRNTKLQGFESQSLFSEFTEAQLLSLTAELEMGEESMFALLEMERVA